jgi:hypothetical protein
MEIVDSLTKARLLETGEVLYVQCLDASEALDGLNKLKKAIQSLEGLPYSLIAYTQRDDNSTWWVCIAKVDKVGTVYVKKPTGELLPEGEKWITIEAGRIFKLAISDGKSLEEVLDLAVNDLERRYIKELFSTSDITRLPVTKTKRLL